jgi:hypothetical protein
MTSLGWLTAPTYEKLKTVPVDILSHSLSDESTRTQTK